MQTVNVPEKYFWVAEETEVVDFDNDPTIDMTREELDRLLTESRFDLSDVQR